MYKIVRRTLRTHSLFSNELQARPAVPSSKFNLQKHLENFIMSDGKTYNLLSLRQNIRATLFIIITLCYLSQPSYGDEIMALDLQNPTMLRGGLVFSMENKAGPISVNQDFYQVTRSMSTDSLTNGLQATFDSYYQYRDHCNEVRKFVDEYNNFKPPPTVAPKNLDDIPLIDRPINGRVLGGYLNEQLRVLNSEYHCKNLGGIVPEIRDEKQRERLRSFMILHGIKNVYSGLQFDTDNNVYRFKSDNIFLSYKDPVFPKVTYGGDWRKDHTSDLWNWYTIEQAKKYALLITDPGNDFRYRVARNRDQSIRDKIVCEIPVKAEEIKAPIRPSAMTIMTYFACQRDEQSLKDKTEGQWRDIQSMMKIKFSINETSTVLPRLVPEDFYKWDVSRQKRHNGPDPTQYIGPNHTQYLGPDHYETPPEEPGRDQAQEDPAPGKESLNDFEMAQEDHNSDQYLTQEDQEADLDEIYTLTARSETSRSRRALPALPAGLPLMIAGGAANVIYSLAEGGAPLSWTGDALSSIFGLATTSQIKTLRETMEDQGKSIATLQFNQQNIDKMIKQVVDEVHNTTKELTALVLSQQMGVAMKAAEEDIKSINRQLTANNDVTMLRFANILTAARLGKVSPFIISQAELDEQAIKAKREKDVTLDTNMNNIKVTIIVIENQIQLFFNIPVMDDDRLFTFYKITPLPHFQNNATYIPKIDATYIAISAENSEYHTVDADEFNRCIDIPQECKVASPANHLTDSSHCVIRTYMTSQISCPLVESTIPKRPFIRSIGNHTIFSVPESTSIFIKCKNMWTTNSYQDTNTVIKGMGDITFRPGCVITLPDGSKWDTPDIHPLIQMTENMPMYSPYNTMPQASDVKVEYIKHQDINRPQTIYITQEVEKDLDTIDEMISEAFVNKNTLVPFMLRTGAIIMTILMMAFLGIWIYVFCRVKCSGTKWLPCIKPFPEPDQDIMTVKDQINHMQRQLKSTYKNFKDSSSNLSNRLTRSSYDVSRANYNAEAEAVELITRPSAPILKKGVSFEECSKERL